MSVDPDPASAPEPTPAKNPPESAGESAELTRLKRRFKKGSGEPEENENPDQKIQLLSSLLQDLIAKKSQPAAEPEPAKTAKYHRLSKTGGAAVPAPAGEPGPGVLPTVHPIGGPVEPAATAPAGGAVPVSGPFRPAPVFDSPESRRRLCLWKILCLLGILASAAATYFITGYFRPAGGKLDSSSKTPPTPPGAWSDASLQQLDRSLTADQAGDIPGALRTASAIQAPGTPPLPGLGLYLAGLRSRAGLTFDAEADLLRMSTGAPPLEAALIDERLAFNYSRTRDFEKANDHYREASRLDPLSASLFYHWGETARHLGHFSDALAAYRRALDRVPTGQPENESLRECINLKIRLCGVEEGKEESFQPELAERLKTPVPSGYWLLTAAASALQHKDLPGAAGFLGRAREVLGPAQFDALLNDYFFRAYADRKELADFFPPDPAARRAKLQPTMAYTIEP